MYDYNISASSVDSVAIGSKTIHRFIAEDLNHFKIKKYKLILLISINSTKSSLQDYFCLLSFRFP